MSEILAWLPYAIAAWILLWGLYGVVTSRNLDVAGARGNGVSRAAVWSRASITVLPVTWIAESAIPSRSRLARARGVGAKWSSARWLARTRFFSSGKGW